MKDGAVIQPVQPNYLQNTDTLKLYQLQRLSGYWLAVTALINIHKATRTDSRRAAARCPELSNVRTFTFTRFSTAFTRRIICSVCIFMAFFLEITGHVTWSFKNATSKLDLMNLNQLLDVITNLLHIRIKSSFCSYFYHKLNTRLLHFL